MRHLRNVIVCAIVIAVFVALFSLLRKENTPKSYEPPISETTQTVVAEKANLSGWLAVTRLLFEKKMVTM